MKKDNSKKTKTKESSPKKKPASVKAKVPEKKVSENSVSPRQESKSQMSKNSFNIQPVGDRILIKPFLVEETQGKNSFGIIIPDTVSKETPERGKVLAVGGGRYDASGNLVPMSVKTGDTVIFSKYGFDEVSAGEEKLYILKEDNILAIVS